MVETQSAHGTPGHKCLTGCASTFHRAMQERRNSRATLQLNRINEYQVEEDAQRDADTGFKDKCDSMEDIRSGSDRSSMSPCAEILERSKLPLGNIKARKLSLQVGGRLPAINRDKISSLIQNIQEKEEKEEEVEARPTSGFNTEKRRNSLAKILSPLDPDIVEGQYTLIDSHNYEQYLEGIGTGPLSRNMVLGAKVVVSITQTPDWQWQINMETAIKAKSIKGYATFNRKLTQNKFKVGEAKPELLDDWDQRLVVTTIYREEDGSRLRLEQVAEKDQKFQADSTVIYSVDREDQEVLTMTCMLDNISAWRKFQRVEPKKSAMTGRRHSVF